MKKRGKERRKLVWEKFGMNPVGPNLRGFTKIVITFCLGRILMLLVSLERLLLGLQFGHMNDLKRSPYEGVMPIRSWTCGADFAIGHNCVQAA